MNKESGKIIVFPVVEKEVEEIPVKSKVFEVGPDVAERELGKHKKDKNKKD